MTDTDYIVIGRRIRKFRNARNMTQADLAEKAHLSNTYISHIESANKKASLESLIAIANALNITVDDLLLGNLKKLNYESSEDISSLLSECTLKEKLFISELSKAVISILHKNKWQL